jgi:RNA polymerase sigma-B factor
MHTQRFIKTMSPPTDKYPKFREFREARANHHTAIAQRLLTELLKEHRPLAIAFAQRRAASCPEDLEDLKQLTMMGLVKAIERFDPDLGNAFSSYAERWINGEVLHHIRDRWSGAKIPRRQVEKHGEVLRTHRKMTAAGREMTLEQVAIGLGMDGAAWRELSDGMARQPMLSFDGGLTGVALRMPEDDHREELHAELRQQVAALESPGRLYVMDRFFRGMDDGAIARNYGVSTAEVERAIGEALGVLERRIKLEEWA